MWLFLAAIVVCFTIVVLFRMYLDLKRQEQQHSRLVQADHRNHERYVAITRQETIQEIAPLIEKIVRSQQPALPPARYIDDAMDFSESIPPIPSDRQIIDARTLEALKRTYSRNDYERFIENQKRIARRTL